MCIRDRVGAYQDRSQAQRLLSQLNEGDFPAFMVADNGLYKVRVGAFLNLDNAARMEQTLRSLGSVSYTHLIIYERKDNHEEDY